jgi:hypothetical protein
VEPTQFADSPADTVFVTIGNITTALGIRYLTANRAIFNYQNDAQQVVEETFNAELVEPIEQE